MSPLWSDLALARATAAKAGLRPEQPQADGPRAKANATNPVRRILHSKRASFAL
jgi:hypothetical protein